MNDLAALQAERDSLAKKLDEARAEIGRLRTAVSVAENQIANARRVYDGLLAAVQVAIADDRERLGALLAAIRDRE